MRARDFPVDESEESEAGLYEWAVHIYRTQPEAGEPCRQRSDVFIDPGGHAAVIILRDARGRELAFYRANGRGLRRSP
jgi:hypothetical protein